MAKYRLRGPRFGHPAGTIVYDCAQHDYGLASDDTRGFGIEHISVSLTEDGDYPFFTVPVVQLEKLP